MRPPINAMIKIKNYCEKTQCGKCDFGEVYDNEDHYVSCTLLDSAPCDWEIKGEQDAYNTIKKSG